MRQRRRAETAPGIAGGGLYEEVLERALAQDPAVRHAVERDATGHAQIVRVDPRPEPAHFLEQQLFERELCTARDIVMERRQLRLRCPGRSAKQIAELVREHPRA